MLNCFISELHSLHSMFFVIRYPNKNTCLEHTARDFRPSSQSVFKADLTRSNCSVQFHHGRGAVHNEYDSTVYVGLIRCSQARIITFINWTLSALSPTHTHTHICVIDDVHPHRMITLMCCYVCACVCAWYRGGSRWLSQSIDRITVVLWMAFGCSATAFKNTTRKKKHAHTHTKSFHIRAPHTKQSIRELNETPFRCANVCGC